MNFLLRVLSFLVLRTVYSFEIAFVRSVPKILVLGLHAGLSSSQC